jgi:hypothetical protein
MASHPGDDDQYPLVPEGKDYYKQLFPDVLYFWRQIYNPNHAGEMYITDPTITEGSMKPTHWFGTGFSEEYPAIPEERANDYNNIYVQRTVDDEDVYVPWGSTIDLSALSDVFDANNNSLYDKTGYADRALVYQASADPQVNFYNYVDSVVKNNGLNWTNGDRITKLQSYYFKQNGRTGYTQLYTVQPIAFAKPQYDDEKWNNELTLLLYNAPGNETYTLVRSVELEDGKKYCGAHS